MTQIIEIGTIVPPVVLWDMELLKRISISNLKTLSSPFQLWSQERGDCGRLAKVDQKWQASTFEKPKIANQLNQDCFLNPTRCWNSTPTSWKLSKTRGSSDRGSEDAWYFTTSKTIVWKSWSLLAATVVYRKVRIIAAYFYSCIIQCLLIVEYIDQCIGF